MCNISSQMNSPIVSTAATTKKAPYKISSFLNSGGRSSKRPIFFISSRRYLSLNAVALFTHYVQNITHQLFPAVKTVIDIVRNSLEGNNAILLADPAFMFSFLNCHFQTSIGTFLSTNQRPMMLPVRLVVLSKYK